MADNNEKQESVLERFGLALAVWSEKWFPDAWIFALLGVVIVFIFGILIGESPEKLVLEGGKSFWTLIPFTMQMALIIIGGYVVATSPPVHLIIKKVAGITTNPRAAIAWVAFFSMTTSLISWGLSLIFSGLLVREMARNIKGLDYRAAGSAGYLGLGAVWALGLSSSAPLMMSTKGAIPSKLFAISGLIPLTQTLFIWPNFWTIVALITTSVTIPGKDSGGLRPENRPHRCEPRTQTEAWRVVGIQPPVDHHRRHHARLLPARHFQ